MPKRRHISIASLADRVVHQAVNAVVAPLFERGFITDTYASLNGRGQHAAVWRFEQFRSGHAWVLQAIARGGIAAPVFAFMALRLLGQWRWSPRSIREWQRHPGAVA